MVDRELYAAKWAYHFKLVDFGNSHFDDNARDTYGTKVYGMFANVSEEKDD